MSEVYDYAIKRRDDECNSAPEALYWAAYLDGVIAAQKEIENLGKGCGGVLEILALRERLASVSKERDKLRVQLDQIHMNDEKAPAPPYVPGAMYCGWNNSRIGKEERAGAKNE